MLAIGNLAKQISTTPGQVQHQKSQPKKEQELATEIDHLTPKRENVAELKLNAEMIQLIWDNSSEAYLGRQACRRWEDAY